MLSLIADKALLFALKVPVPGNNPPPFADKIIEFMGWFKWIGMAACVLGLIIFAISLAFASQRQTDTRQLMGNFFYPVLAAVVISGAVAIVGFAAN